MKVVEKIVEVPMEGKDKEILYGVNSLTAKLTTLEKAMAEEKDRIIYLKENQIK